MFDVERFRRQDRQYFDEIIDRYASLVMHTVRSFAADADHADDLFQEAWTHVYRKAAGFGGEGSIEAWIHRVATNVCLSEYRSAKARGELGRRYAGDAFQERVPRDPFAGTDHGERLEKLHRAIAQLPNRQYQTVAMRVLDGLSSAETALAMGLTPAAVRSNMRHAIKRLRTLMEDGGEELPRYGSTR